MFGKVYRFSSVIPGDSALQYIFPTKQRAAQEAINIAREEEKVLRLIVFGSAVTPKCGMTSDLDLAIDAPDLSEDDFIRLSRRFYRGVDSELDLIHYNSIQNSLL